MDGVRELVSKPKHDWDAVQAPMLIQQNSNISNKCGFIGVLVAPVGLLDLRRLRLQDFLRNFLSAHPTTPMVLSESYNP